MATPGTLGKRASHPRFGVVVKEVAGAEGPMFRAIAYVLRHSGERAPVLNGAGHQIAAFGASPVKATIYLLSALRRKSLIESTTLVATPQLSEKAHLASALSRTDSAHH